jgi:prepilin-type N-terminal cleavage/methylation domain-containing protein
MRSPRPNRCPGFTLIEVLVVIALIGVLVGLLLPAVQSAREAGRRTQCQDNMRNVGMGIQAYVEVNGKYPPAGVISDVAILRCPDDTTIGRTREI